MVKIEGAEDEEATHDQGAQIRSEGSQLVVLSRALPFGPVCACVICQTPASPRATGCPPERLPQRTGADPSTPQLSAPSFNRTLRLASISAASTAACAASRRYRRVAYSGSVSQ